MAITLDRVREIFKKLENGDGGEFFTHVADDVDWTVEGTHPLAGHYHGKADFLAHTFAELARVLPKGTLLHLENVLTSGDWAVVELHSLATATNGLRFDNRYCWLCRFKDGKIVEVRAYLDSALVARLFEENPISETTKAPTPEDRLARLDIHLPEAPTPFGAYVPAVQTGNLLFLSGTLATSGHTATMVGIVGKDLDVKSGRDAARTAALNALALAKKHLGSLNRITHVVRLGVHIAATPQFTDHIKIADAASELFRDVLGEQTVSSRLVLGAASLPLGSPVELEVILELQP